MQKYAHHNLINIYTVYCHAIKVNRGIHTNGANAHKHDFKKR